MFLIYICNQEVMAKLLNFKYLYMEGFFFSFYKISLPDNISQIKFNFQSVRIFKSQSKKVLVLIWFFQLLWRGSGCTALSLQGSQLWKATVCLPHTWGQTETPQVWGRPGSTSVLHRLMWEKAAPQAVFEIWLQRAKLSSLLTTSWSQVVESVQGTQAAAGTGTWPSQSNSLSQFLFSKIRMKPQGSYKD